MTISGFGIAGFRSFGAIEQRIGPFAKINLIVGQNNTGKSNVLTALGFVRAALSHTTGRATTDTFNQLNVDDLNRCRNAPNAQRTFSVLLAVSKQDFYDYMQFQFPSFKEKLAGHNPRAISDEIHSRFSNPNGQVWLKYLAQDLSCIGPEPKTLVQQITAADRSVHVAWELAWQSINSKRGGAISDWVSDVLRALTDRARLQFPPMHSIHSDRRVTADSIDPSDRTLNGEGLIVLLAQLERPEAHELERAQVFKKIVEFAREVLEDPSVDLEIPHTRKTILIAKDGRKLPIEALGTGIRQVIIFAAAASTISDSFITIEEPETNLHPTLQRKLISFLAHETTNTYFITTHSAHILDAGDAAICRVDMVNGMTTLTNVNGPNEQFELCRSLGYRASDLVQSPCVIWVEGPSDRIYVAHWLKQVDETLSEGIHYSVMFYGGRLLSHLTATDVEEDVNSFISLRRLNRFVALIMDSDRTAAGVRINATKTRIKKELTDPPQDTSFVWITEGREIENYLPPEIMAAAIRSHRDGAVPFSYPVETDYKYAKAYSFSNAKGIEVTTADKVAIALSACMLKTPDYLGRDRRVAELAVFIRLANSLPQLDPAL